MYKYGGTIFWFLVVLFTTLMALTISGIKSEDKRQQGIDHVRKVCEETGMYLTEGYAISCRVLKNVEKQIEL